MAETTAAARKAQITTKLDSLTERDREIGREVGAKLADGKAVPPKLRTERATLREDIEDMVAALPHLDRQMQAETTAQAAEVQAEKQARLSAVKSEAADLGQELREAWGPVARIVKEAHVLDPVYRAASKASTGRGDDPVAEPMGVPLKILRALADISSRLEAV